MRCVKLGSVFIENGLIIKRIETYSYSAHYNIWKGYITTYVAVVSIDFITVGSKSIWWQGFNEDVKQSLPYVVAHFLV